MTLHLTGSNAFGMLTIPGDENEDLQYMVPTVAETLQQTRFSSVALGGSHALAVTTSGELYVWGDSYDGKLGLGRKYQYGDETVGPKKCGAFDLQVVRQASAGYNHSMVLCINKPPYAFGAGETGQLGVNVFINKPRRDINFDVDAHPSPVLCKEFLRLKIDISSVACGEAHTLFLSTAGQVYAAGEGRKGQLGIGQDGITLNLKVNRTAVEVPTLLSALDIVPIVAIAAGDQHSLAVSSSGTVYAWGHGKRGKLGLGHSRDVWEPERVASAPVTVTVSAGTSFSAVVSEAGSVYTCGSNNFGQLGLGNSDDYYHFTKVNAIGSRAVQVSCGMSHTLVLDNQGCVFACGSARQGQLGIGETDLDMVNTFTEMVLPSNTPVCTGIYAGSNLSALLLSAKRSTAPTTATETAHTIDDTKESKQQPQQHVLLNQVPVLPAAFNYEKFAFKLASCKKSGDFREFAAYLQGVFSSPAALNASFLTPVARATSEQERCRINAVLLEEVYTQILSVSKAQPVILRTMRQALLTAVRRLSQFMKQEKKLKEAVAFRCVLIILHYPVLSRGSLREAELLADIAKIIQRLTKVARVTLQAWLAEYPADLFVSRFVHTVKNAIGLRLIEEKQRRQGALIQTAGEDVQHNIDLFTILWKANAARTDVPESAFYVPEIGTCVDLKADYIAFIQPVVPPVLPPFSFCNHGFMLDLATKRQVLMIEVAIRKQNRLLTAMVTQSQPVLELSVRRQHLIEDTLEAFHHLKPYDFCKQLKVTFVGEAGVDAGGLTAEYFNLVMQAFFDSDQKICELERPLFVHNTQLRTLEFAALEAPNGVLVGDGDSPELQPTPAPPVTDQPQQLHGFFDKPHNVIAERLKLYELFGTLLGLACFNGVYVNAVRFPRFIWNALCGRGKTSKLADLKEFDERLHQSLMQLLEYDGGDVEDVFGLTFCVTETGPDGKYVDVPLVKNGTEIAVTDANRKRYVELYVRYRCFTAVKKPLRAMTRGFLSICDGFALKLFSPDELALLLCGERKLSFKELRSTVRYEGGSYANPDDPYIEAVWHFLSTELTREDKKKFLTFVTGSPVTPLGGLAKVKLTIQRAGPDTDQLPTSYTCYHMLMLPEYSSIDKMKEKLRLAIESSQHAGFGLQ